MIKKSKNAFTLVELLVVIAIISVLVGLLIPAVGHVRQRANVAEAAYQTQKMTGSLTTYQENVGRFPQGDGTDASTKNIVTAFDEYKKSTGTQLYEFTEKNKTKEDVWINPYQTPFFYRENASKKTEDKKNPPEMFKPDTYDIWTFMSDWEEKKIEYCEVNNWGGSYKTPGSEKEAPKK